MAWVVVVVGSGGVLQARTPTRLASGGADLVEPPVLSSREGILRVKLEAAEREVVVAGRRATALSFNGQVPGPGLRPGDRLQVAMVNRLAIPTSVRVHGLHVCPQGNSDNPFIGIRPGERFDYEFQIPMGHPNGTDWHHSHRHGLVIEQVFGGLYGGIIIVGDPDIPSTRERPLIIADVTLDGAGRVGQAPMGAAMTGREGELVLVDGQLNPHPSARPGERERWRVVNACTSRYLRLGLPGRQVQLLAPTRAHPARSHGRRHAVHDRRREVRPPTHRSGGARRRTPREPMWRDVVNIPAGARASYGSRSTTSPDAPSTTATSSTTKIPRSWASSRSPEPVLVRAEHSPPHHLRPE